MMLLSIINYFIFINFSIIFIIQLNYPNDDVIHVNANDDVDFD